MLKLRTGRSRPGVGLCVALAALLLTACADSRYRQQSDDALARGAYEEAMGVLQEGLKSHPDSTLLRAGMVQARQAALQRLIDEVQLQLQQGDLAKAQQALQRALALEPANLRLRGLQGDVETERRQRQALIDARAQLENRRPEQALRTVAAALQDNPRHAELQALKRQLEDEARQLELQTGRALAAQSKPISLDFRDAALRNVLDLISRHSGVNYVVDRDVRADLRVTVLMQDAAVEDALDLLLSTNQLAKKIVDARTIVVYPNTPEKSKEYQEQVVRVFYLNSGEARGAANFLRAMLRIGEPFVDERTNMIALRDSAENIRLAERLIGLYDAGEPEVLLELEVLEVNTRRMTELGVKWPDSFSLTPLPPAGESRLTLANIEGLGRSRLGLGISGLLVNLKREVGDFSTLANPRIRVKNREKARVLVGDKIPVITTVTGQTGFVSDNISYLDVGLKLDVEPAIYADDEVAIKVALEVSSLGTAVRTAAGALAYQIGTRSASTNLRLRDGEIQLLAGLISRDERTSASRLPGAGDLPVLGRLFSSTLDNAQKTELVLAVTPRVLRNVRRPTVTESEVWIGTEARPALRTPRWPARDASATPATDAAVPGAPRSDEAPPAPARSSPVAPPRLSWQGPSQVKVGETLALALQVEQARDLRAVPLDLVFDPAYWAYVGVDEGDLLAQGGAATALVPDGNPGSGSWSLSALRRPATGAQGDGRLLTLRLRALKPGASRIGLRGARAVSAKAEVLSLGELPEHAVEIQAKP